MMIVVQDRDLAARDPGLFLDAGSVAQTLGQGTDGMIRNGILTVNDIDFLAVAQPGQVAIGTGESSHVMEILEVVDSSTLDVSSPRFSLSEAKINPVEGTDLLVTILTFSSFLSQSTAWALKNLRMDQVADDSPQAGIIAASDSLKELILTRAIADIYQSVSASLPENTSLQSRANLWKSKLAARLEQTEIGVDVDGDGRTDATRRMNVIVLTR